MFQANWTFPGGCIIASFSLSLAVPMDPTDATKLLTVTLDPSKKGVAVQGSCNVSATAQGIGLGWEDKDATNPNNTLMRGVSMMFNEDKNASTYGISMIMGLAEVK